MSKDKLQQKADQLKEKIQLVNANAIIPMQLLYIKSTICVIV